MYKKYAVQRPEGKTIKELGSEIEIKMEIIIKLRLFPREPTFFRALRKNLNSPSKLFEMEGILGSFLDTLKTLKTFKYYHLKMLKFQFQGSPLFLGHPVYIWYSLERN